MLDVPKSVIELLNRDIAKKNFRIHFPNGERDDLTNHDVNEESVEFTESICSQYGLKFGLCEASVLKFSTLDVGNIKGMKIKAYLDIDCKLEKSHVKKSGSRIVLYSGVDFEETDAISMEFLNLAESEMAEILVEYKNLTTGTASVTPDPLVFAVMGSAKVIESGHDNRYGAAIDKITISSSSNIFVDVIAYNKKYSIPFGSFTIRSCKKQDDLSRRSIVAYSNYLNVDEEKIESPFEMLKFTIGSGLKTPYKFDVCKYALASISQHVDLDYNGMNIVMSDVEPSVVDSEMSFSYGWKLRVEITLKTKMLTLEDYDALVGYTAGEELTKFKEIKDLLISFIDKYFFYVDYDSFIKRVQTFWGVSGAVYGKNSKDYVGLNNSGMVYKKDVNGTGHSDYIQIPYEATIKVLDTASTVVTELDAVPIQPEYLVLETHKFNLFQEENIKFFFVDFDNSDFKLPKAEMEIGRVKNQNGLYSVDITKLPDVSKVFKAMLELNGLFFVQDRTTEKYNFLNLSGAGAVVYPDEDSYPSEDSYPGETDIILGPENYFKVWYDDEPVEPYDEVLINYVDNNNEEHCYRVYDPVYNEIFDEPVFSEPVSSEVALDILSKPFKNGEMLYFEAGGMVITEILVQPTGEKSELVFSGKSELVTASENWENYGKIYVYVDVESIENTDDMYVKVGRYEREEIEVKRKTLDLSNNYIINNFKFDEGYIIKAIEQCLENISDCSYMPCDIELIGLPYVQAGDSFAVVTAQGEGIESIVLSRTLKGINALVDNYVSN